MAIVSKKSGIKKGGSRGYRTTKQRQNRGRRGVSSLDHFADPKKKEAERKRNINIPENNMSDKTSVTKNSRKFDRILKLQSVVEEKKSRNFENTENLKREPSLEEINQVNKHEKIKLDKKMRKGESFYDYERRIWGQVKKHSIQQGKKNSKASQKAQAKFDLRRERKLEKQKEKMEKQMEDPNIVTIEHKGVTKQFNFVDEIKYGETVEKPPELDQFSKHFEKLASRKGDKIDTLTIGKLLNSVDNKGNDISDRDKAIELYRALKNKNKSK
eukprot:TRINITY_DN1946_c0_g1_i1.p1 TRINITY_DN1946_c0_g1~~TRINITY_DN1946_c0_g1_i1.p1  ORF type:complete len:271 (+),score=86.99 TRINITY_DN1946_c0_g1_i1:116-928(+)